MGSVGSNVFGPMLRTKTQNNSAITASVELSVTMSVFNRSLTDHNIKFNCRSQIADKCVTSAGLQVLYGICFD